MPLVDAHSTWVRIVDSKFGWDITLLQYENPYVFIFPHDVQIIINKGNNVNLSKLKLRGKTIFFSSFKERASDNTKYYEGIKLTYHS